MKVKLWQNEIITLIQKSQNEMISQKETPNSYLKHYRIMKSCQLLKDTNRSISEIADSCGFQSVSYFFSVFRKSMGVSPAKYRKQKNND